jgi:hypothetical protein
MRFPRIIANTFSLLAGIVFYSALSLFIAHLSGIAYVYWVGDVLGLGNPPEPPDPVISPQSSSIRAALLDGAYLMYSYQFSKMEIGIIGDPHVQARLKDPASIKEAENRKFEYQLWQKHLSSLIRQLLREITRDYSQSQITDALALLQHAPANQSNPAFLNRYLRRFGELVASYNRKKMIDEWEIAMDIPRISP